MDTNIPTVRDIALQVDAENKSETGLTSKQELFCKYYTTLGDTLFNGRLSYAKAYGYDLATASTVRIMEMVIDKDGKEVQQGVIGSSELEKMENYCTVGGSRLTVWNDNVIARIHELTLANFNDDTIADKRLEEIIQRGKDTDAIQAIKHRNDLKQRITKKLDITSANRPLAGLSDDDLRKMAGAE